MRVSNSLDPDQTQCSVRPDLCPKCLPISAADKISSLAGQSQFQLLFMFLSSAELPPTTIYWSPLNAVVH